MKSHLWIGLFFSYFLIAAILYSPSLGGPFQYDDYAQILDNKVLTGRPLPKLLSSIFRFTAHLDGWTGTRDFVRATFLVNWQRWGEEPLGYRWVNLLVHVINSFLVTALIRLLLPDSKWEVGNEKLDSEMRSGKSNHLWLAIFAGLLFLVHPLNSQAVAYIAQRFTSVATLFYLLTIILYIIYNNYKNYNYNGYNRYKSYIIYGGAVGAALLAYNSKEIAVTLPMALLLAALYNRYKNYKIYLLLVPFFLLALKIPFQTATAAARGGESPAAAKIELGSFALQQKEELVSRRDYFLTQISVVATYLRLAVLPTNQTLDYDYPITRAPDPKTLALAALHLGLVGTGVWLLFGYRFSVFGYQSIVNRFSVNQSKTDKLKTDQPETDPPAIAFGDSRWRAGNGKPKTDNWRSVGLGILWFYLTLLPESSIIPIPDVIYEHRAYLPLVGLILAAAALSAAGYNRYKNYKTYPLSAAIFLLVFFSIGTLRRAVIWGNEVRLWADVYAKAPVKPRAVKNYGVVLAASGKYDKGIELLETAVKLDPDNADYFSNLGTANLRAGRYDAAKDKFLQAYELLAAELKLPPYNTPFASFASFASLDLSEKNRRQAAQYLNDYGVCLVQLNKGDEALAAFQKSLAIDPTLYAARLGLGAAYNVLGETQKAIDVFEAAVEEFSDLPDAYNNLAVMYKKAGRMEDHNRILRASPKSAKSP